MTEAVSEDLAEPHGAVETSVVDATPVANPPPRVSVIIPAFDEAENMPELFSELAETFRDHDLRAEVLLVDDGSRDKTYQAAREAAAAAGLDDAVFLQHRANRGKTQALVTAARVARGDYLVLFDADLQHSTEEIPRYVARLDAGDDLVSGYKVGPYKKRVVSGIYNRISRLIFRVPVRDLNSMKAFRREVLDAVHLRKDWHRYLVVLAHAEGYRLSEIDIELHPRRHGQPKYQGRTRIVIGALDLVAVWFQLVFSRKPMLFFGVTGVGLMGLGVLVGLVELYLRFGLGQGFRPLLTLVSLLITVGLLLLILGFLAELIAALRGEVEELRKEVRRHRD
jgi:glycosyltransferase involved in cell wall biosynthesis